MLRGEAPAGGRPGKGAERGPRSGEDTPGACRDTGWRGARGGSSSSALLYSSQQKRLRRKT